MFLLRFRSKHNEKEDARPATTRPPSKGAADCGQLVGPVGDCRHGRLQHSTRKGLLEHDEATGVAPARG
ncbi:hypothetical protein GW17_00052064 [Ensete ventricosum]|nr:hypothetical protein GW17_00052064 [Ensete ventricosum]